ncbi:TraR/DksA family transcriptional regulator [Salinicola endophyticus]|uniref:TraR/DksA family transcriptional regulator n=1 Tax=Salinicola endophyticus TaxID=1949083 RepID=A0ABY8FC91_9GAMM|nr:TraR/DksA C4-type zinc finger protein [Salinicola endophyticus]WFF40412.1 TraR/DksA family transcriptional regulator [Salinicola endophyticus]
MADRADIANELIDERMAQALAARQGPRRHTLPVSDECADCGETIPAARRERMPYATRCVACQTRREGRR